MAKVDIFNLKREKVGELELSDDVFGAEVKEHLFQEVVAAQLASRRAGTSAAKERSAVQGSSKKIYKQKGTGGARHGSIRAPIFVGGGVALGPKSRKVTLDFPQKMKKAAIISALSLRNSEGEVLGVAGLEKATGKTSQVGNFIKALEKKSTLFILGDKNDNVQRAASNLQKISVVTAGNLNTLEILTHKTIVVSKDAVTMLGGVK